MTDAPGPEPTVTPTRRAERDGVRLGYRIHNPDAPGRPLVMVMGLGGVKEDWRHLAPALAADRPVLVLDNRGIGESDVPEGPYTMSMMAEDTLAVMTEAGFGESDLLGISMGGMIAQQMALAAGERFGAIVLGCTMHGGRGQTVPEQWVLDAIQPRPDLEPIEAVRRMMRVNYTDDWIARNPEGFEALCQDRLRHTRRVKGIEAQLAAIQAFDLEHDVQRIERPTLVLHGTADVLLPFANAESLASKIPHAELATMPGVGHVFWDMDEGMSVTLIRDFLERH